MDAGGRSVRRGLPWRPLAAAVALGSLAVALAGPAHVVLERCVPGEGAIGWLGLRLALLRSSADCPDGALGVGGTGAHSALIVVSVALPTLLLHLVAAACGASLSAVLARGAGVVRAVLDAARFVLPAAPHPPWPRAGVVVGSGVARSLPRRVLARHRDRGPPALQVA